MDIIPHLWPLLQHPRNAKIECTPLFQICSGGGESMPEPTIMSWIPILLPSNFIRGYGASQTPFITSFHATDTGKHSFLNNQKTDVSLKIC
jgi:hypothetical protein